jgi:hypothetical protein
MNDTYPGKGTDYDPVAAVTQLYKVLPGACLFPCPLWLLQQLGAAFPLYGEFTPEHYRAIVDAITEVSPDTEISAGWGHHKQILLRLDATQFTRRQWMLVLKAIGEAHATYQLSDLEYLIWWKTEDEE